MRLAILGGAAVLAASASQVPFHVYPEAWDLNVAPSINATGHLVFDTVSSFLQHWPNTRYRNGHSLVPGTVPVGTLLYHGRGDSNPEHSYMFCRGSAAAGCWHLTLVAVRPLRVLYFDGSSAGKNEKRPHGFSGYKEQRSLDLCAWGKPLGIDGFLREIILCDFTAGVEMVSMANLASAGWGIPGPGGPRRPPPGEPLDYTAPAVAEVILSGSWHNRYPGDRRIKLDLTQLISFYDTMLVPSLIPERFTDERWEHRLLGISPEDIAAVKRRLATFYTTPLTASSGVDWDTLFKVIVDRYDTRLEVVQYLLSTPEAPLASAKKAMKQFRVMLTPYILNSAVPAEQGNSWAAPVFAFCATSHTSHIRRNAFISEKLTDSEHLLLHAVEETNREICRVVVSMWAEGVLAGLDDSLPPPHLPVHDEGPSEALVQKWKSAVEGLMSWLDWSVWIKCRPECGFEEICYLPTWPFGRLKRPEGGEGRAGPPGRGFPMPDDPEILHPQPQCVRRFD
ncbi:hypothetical protein FB45DRAFT_928277 [Roridomyces roridus]|uniref:Uncharacterized protein n=1 Tax=Roridomyces roridus TaxID=1738132 RepID=A0AAD7BH39_9AGAR|nr:hypothetical protein FB45DRAFT_928277 [Roridomyces roridus]